MALPTRSRREVSNRPETLRDGCLASERTTSHASSMGKYALTPFYRYSRARLAFEAIIKIPRAQINLSICKAVRASITRAAVVQVLKVVGDEDREVNAEVQRSAP